MHKVSKTGGMQKSSLILPVHARIFLVMFLISFECATCMHALSIEEIVVKNKSDLEKIVVEEISKIESGLTVIGRQIPTNDSTTIDILCQDYNGQLVVLKLSLNEDNMMLFEGLHILNEINCVRRMLKFFNKNHKINDKEPGRLILLAPSFSNDLLAIANGISSVRIALYEWEYLRFGDNKALRVTPISLSQASNNR
jgi:RecB family endonuclease NucS